MSKDPSVSEQYIKIAESNLENNAQNCDSATLPIITTWLFLVLNAVVVRVDINSSQ